MSMDIQVKKFIDTYNEESPPDKKIDVYVKKEQITYDYDSWPEIAEETDEQSTMNI